MSITLQVEDKQLRKLMRELDKQGVDGRKPLEQLDRAVRTQMGVEWTKARAATGGTVRGQVWEPMKAQYTRKDGTVVPAWGGVARAKRKGKKQGKKATTESSVTEQVGIEKTKRKKRTKKKLAKKKAVASSIEQAGGKTPKRGRLKGRRRPSGKFVTANSIIGQDRGTLRSSIIRGRANIVIGVRHTVLKIGANMPKYGRRIMRYDNRNILRWTPEDKVTFRRIAVAYLKSIVRSNGVPR